ncbi:MAG: EAL domain-containing protein [Bacillus subtilis]|nr:EAL domain-containing protein [Bacillus subtilis]
MSKRIVSLTVLLTALFLVVVMAILAYLYVTATKASEEQTALTQSGNTAAALQAFVLDTKSTIEQMAENSDVILYLTQIRAGMDLVPNASEPERQMLYNRVMQMLDTVQEYSPEAIYDFVFLATDVDCTDGDDGCYIGSENVTSPDTWKLSERPWYIDHIESGQDFSVSLPYVDQRTGAYVITYVHTIYDGVVKIGMIGIDTYLTSIPLILDKYEHGSADSSKETLLFHRREEVSTIMYFSNPAYPSYLFASGDQIAAIDATNGFALSGLAAIVNPSTLTYGELTQTTLFDGPHFVFYEAIPDTDWVIVVLTPNPSFIGIEWTYLILLGSVIATVVLISMFLTKRINKTLAPIGQILNSIDEIKKGNFSSRIKVKDNNELKTVADAINMMSQEIGDQIDLVYRSYLYDSITGLKTRRASHGAIEEEFLVGNEKTAILLIDVDNLKNINVTKGQSVGDEILKAFAERLQKAVRYPDAVYFNGSNEFIFIMPKIKNLELVESEIQRVFDRFREPIAIKNLKIEVRSHIGVAVYPYDGKTMDDLIKKCDTALFKAKEAGRGSYIFYNDQITREVTYNAQINEQLADALEKGQLYLKYQPLIDNRSEIYGFEALVRWNSPTLGEISPQVFIANAEESQMIIPIGNWILKEACKTQVLLRERFQKPFVMSVNVSPVQILQKDFMDILKAVIRESDIDPKQLVLEITENVVMESSYLLEKTIEFIHEIGAKIALDDFGTGYASLTYLRQLPFDNLKIDKSFVDGIFASKKDHSIIGTIVELVHNLNMKVVAEGVETRKQYEFLKQITTDIFQGFLFSEAAQV